MSDEEEPPGGLDPPPHGTRRVTFAVPGPPSTVRTERRRAVRARGRRRLAALVAVIAVVAIAAAALIVGRVGLNSSGPACAAGSAGAGSGIVDVRVAPGDSARQIGDLLASSGVVASGAAFERCSNARGDNTKLRAGRFALRHHMSYIAALAVLTGARAAPGLVRITIPEGYTRRQIAGLAHASGLRGSYLRASRGLQGFHPRAYGAPARLHTLEGFLFPATYELDRGASMQALVNEQLDAFGQNFGGLNFAHARAAHLTQYDVLIIASMIEREAQVPADRRLVAAVIYNRLRDGIPLGIDATLRYALNDFTHPLTESELADPTPYNTRLHHGLPPTPISNPGLASMFAAANPAHVSYLYYVDKPNTCGKLAFARTNAEFQADVDAYNAARARNGGRAPTRCP